MVFGLALVGLKSGLDPGVGHGPGFEVRDRQGDVPALERGLRENALEPSVPFFDFPGFAGLGVEDQGDVLIRLVEQGGLRQCNRPAARVAEFDVDVLGFDPLAENRFDKGMLDAILYDHSNYGSIHRLVPFLDSLLGSKVRYGPPYWTASRHLRWTISIMPLARSTAQIRSS
jgi:hypothetical protein